MFGRKKVAQPSPVLTVIGVDYTKGDIILKEDSRFFGNHVQGSTITSKDVKTVVLYTVDGKLETRWLDGKWTLEQVKNWKAE